MTIECLMLIIFIKPGLPIFNRSGREHIMLMVTNMGKFLICIKKILRLAKIENKNWNPFKGILFQRKM